MVQSLNTKAIYTLATIAKRPSLLVPQVSVPTLSDIHFGNLAALGIQAVVLDKDHTITAPYDSSSIHPSATAGVEAAVQVFGKEKVAILSNSAGTLDDVDYQDALEIEEKLGLAVIRHQEKKPGGLEEMLEHFGMDDATEICIVGDRILTDIVFGNLYGLLTIHTQPLPLEDPSVDNWTARWIRPVENTVMYGGERRKAFWKQTRVLHKLIENEDAILTLVKNRRK